MLGKKLTVMMMMMMMMMLDDQFNMNTFKYLDVFFQQLLVRPLAEDHFLYLCVEKYTYTHIHT